MEAAFTGDNAGPHRQDRNRSWKLTGVPATVAFQDHPKGHPGTPGTGSAPRLRPRSGFEIRFCFGSAQRLARPTRLGGLAGRGEELVQRLVPGTGLAQGHRIGLRVALPGSCLDQGRSVDLAATGTCWPDRTALSGMSGRMSEPTPGPMPEPVSAPRRMHALAGPVRPTP